MSLKNVLLDYGVDLAEQKLIDIINEFWRYFIKNCKLYEDVVSTLYQLVKDGYRLGLITNGDEENVANTLKQHNLNKMFKIKVISSVLKHYKPNLLLFEQALELAKCLPQEAIYVGDSVTDIYGAKRLGLITALIYRDKTQECKTEIEPVFKINSLLELCDIANKISSTNDKKYLSLT
jgi:HAD superfamily hydrolase (TIGR01662 family)